MLLLTDTTKHRETSPSPSLARVKFVTPEEIVVLSYRNPCVSVYSYSYQLIREMIPRGDTCQLKKPVRFGLDTSSNISSLSVCVYSYRGDLLHKIDSWRIL